MSQRHGRAWKLATAALAGLGLAAGPLVALPAYASTDGTQVVINEAYVNGGSAGAAYKNKFVELYNPGGTAVDVSGWSIQYRTSAASGVSNNTIALKGNIPAHDYYLIGLGTNGTNGADLPTPDVSASILNPANGGGTIFLVKGTGPITAPTGDVTDPTKAGASIIDLLGYGTSNTFEKADALAPKTTTDVQSIVRTNFNDSDDNHSDFSLTGDITPKASTPDTTPPGDGTTDPGDGTDPGTGGDPSPPLTIADIQGTTDTSPQVGKTVTTSGIVTAAYPTGGFNGYFIQTPGTGGALDLATHTASDGLFIYSSSSSTVSTVHAGDYIQATGAVSEFNGMTQMTIASAGDVTQLNKASVTAPTPATVVIPPTAAQRESLEGMLVAPQGAYTITDNYSLNQY
ncbi:MAG: lamin tail domain-containing protein, partial [Microbacteriaceae bacterium]